MRPHEKYPDVCARPIQCRLNGGVSRNPLTDQPYSFENPCGVDDNILKRVKVIIFSNKPCYLQESDKGDPMDAMINHSFDQLSLKLAKTNFHCT